MIIISMLVTVVSTFWDKGSAKESGELGNWLLDETLIDWFVAHWTDLSWRRCIWLVLTRAPRVPVASTGIYRPTTCLWGTKPHPPPWGWWQWWWRWERENLLFLILLTSLEFVDALELNSAHFLLPTVCFTFQFFTLFATDCVHYNLLYVASHIAWSF